MTRARVVLAVLGLGALGLVGYALATPSPGPLHRGQFLERVQVHADGVYLHTNRPTDFATTDVVYHPGDQSGWHYHLGTVLLNVEGPPGTFLTFHEGCEAFTIPAGRSFYETGRTPGLLENTGSVDMTVHAGYILPTGAPTRVNTDPPQC